MQELTITKKFVSNFSRELNLREFREKDILHGFMLKPQTSDKRMTYEHIRVRYGWHMSTYEWHTDDKWVHTSDIRITCEYIQVTYGWHTSDIRMTHEYIRMTYRWHTSTYEGHANDIRVTYGWHGVRKKNKVKFFKAFYKSSFKISDL